jgi:hypothetical protein
LGFCQRIREKTPSVLLIFHDPGNDFQELPERWNTLKRMAQTKKQQVASLQSHELNNIRHKISAFEEKQSRFREAFKRRDFFK